MNQSHANFVNDRSLKLPLSVFPTHIIDSESIAISDYVASIVEPTDSASTMAVKLYYAVRDGFSYNPYGIDLDTHAIRASRQLIRDRGHCLDKSLLLVACFRKVGIPAKVGLSRVRNHMATEKLERQLNTDVLTPHCYVHVCIEGKWSKCTPAFDKTICERLGVMPLEWDGESDSLFQAYDRAGGVFMEYEEDYGSFDDLPVPFIIEQMQHYYPHLFDGSGEWVGLGEVQ